MLRFAVRNLLSRPIRSLLSLTGLTVAIAGMVGLFSVSEGLDRLLSDTFGRVPGVVVLQPGAPIPLFSRLPAAWQRELEQVDGVAVVTAEIWQRVNLINGEVVFSPPRFLFGTDIASRRQLQRSVYRSEIEQGRFLELTDIGTSNALISRQIAEQFRVSVGDPLMVNGRELTIVGIYHCGSLLLDVAIILDIGEVRRMTRFQQDSVCGFYVEQQDGVEANELAEKIRARFRNRPLETWQPQSTTNPAPGLLDQAASLLSRLSQSVPSAAPTEDDTTPGADRPGSNPEPTQASSARTTASDPDSGGDDDSIMTMDDSAPLEVRSAVEWASRFERFSRDLNIILLLLTSIGVTIAVLSIVNTMLMSVSERMVEFGVLRANGWSQRDVLRLISFESGLIGLGGGILGSAAGWTGAQVVNAVWPLRARLYASPSLLLFAILFSLILGLLGGLYPALRAIRMTPMNALRRV